MNDRSSLEEQQIIAGSDRLRTAAEIEQEYRSLLAAPVRELWPDAHPSELLVLMKYRLLCLLTMTPAVSLSRLHHDCESHGERDLCS